MAHRSVAYLQGPSSSWSNKERLRNVRARTTALRMRLNVLGPYTPTLESGREAAEDVIKTGVTAAMAFDDLTAMGVLSRFWELGVQVPEQISLTGCDDVFCAALCSPPLTTVRALTSLAWQNRDRLTSYTAVAVSSSARPTHFACRRCCCSCVDGPKVGSKTGHF